MKTATNLYLYAILKAKQFSTINRKLYGIEGQPIYMIAQRDVAAIVSAISQRAIRPERRFLTAHHEVLQQLIHECTVLPISFGMITKNSATVNRLLTKHYQTLNEQLIYLDDKIEMGVTMRWDVSNIYEYFIQRFSELREARNLLSQQTQPTRATQIEVGELFETLLENEREQHLTKFSILLNSICDEIIQNPLRSVEEVLNLVCLIRRSNKEKFERKIIEAAEKWNDNFLINYTGPWPLQSFVRLELEA